LKAERTLLAQKGRINRVRMVELLCGVTKGFDPEATAGDRIRAHRLVAEIQGYLVNRQEVNVGMAGRALFTYEGRR
jgi:hypothetical protein